MKQVLAASLAVLALMSAADPSRAADVGVSIDISRPGVYGRIDIGRYPPPVLVAPQPVWVARPQVVVAQPEPVYLWVPPGHRRHWQRHCAQYRACGAPVYFVQDRWYQQHVAPPPRQADHKHDGKHDGKHDRKHGHDHGDDHGRGHGHGHSKH